MSWHADPDIRDDLAAMARPDAFRDDPMLAKYIVARLSHPDVIEAVRRQLTWALGDVPDGLAESLLIQALGQAMHPAVAVPGRVPRRGIGWLVRRFERRGLGGRG